MSCLLTFRSQMTICRTTHSHFFLALNLHWWYTGTEGVLASTSPTRSPQSVPGLNMAALHNSPTHVHSHAGKGPCLMAGQQTARPDLCIGQNCQPSQDPSLGGAAAAMPEQVTRSNGLYTGQAGLQPMCPDPRSSPSSNKAASYHMSGAATWRGPALHPINIGTSRWAT